MDQIGQTDLLHIPIKTQLRVSFTAMKKISLNRDSAPCAMNQSYSFTQCLRQYVSTAAGCYLDWVDINGYNYGGHDACVSKKQVEYSILKMSNNGSRNTSLSLSLYFPFIVIYRSNVMKMR